jgi:methyl-accepting chemotaxis protein
VLTITAVSLTLGVALSLARAGSDVQADPGAALRGAFIEALSLIVVVVGAAAFTLRAAISEPLARLTEAFEAGVTPRPALRLQDAVELAAAGARLVERARADERGRSASLIRELETRLAAAAGGEPATPFAVLEALGAVARGDLTLRIAGSVPEPAAERYDQAVSLMTRTLVAFSASLQAISASGDRAEAILSSYTDRVAERGSEAETAIRGLAEVTRRDSGFATPMAEGAASVGAAGQQASAHATLAAGAAAAFREIAAAGGEISSTAQLIDELAFQTSMLALNAGVEAARFGEPGRGIAVVAQELRALAQSATKAAKASGAQVDKLVAEASRGAAALGEAEAECRAFSEAAAEIAGRMMAASRELADRRAADAAEAAAFAALAGLGEASALSTQELSGARARIDALVGRLSALIEKFRFRELRDERSRREIRTVR